MRDDKYISIIELQSERNNTVACHQIYPANYDSKQSYQTLQILERQETRDYGDVINPENDQQEKLSKTVFSVIAITHVAQQTSKIIQLDFDATFVQNFLVSTN